MENSTLPFSTLHLFSTLPINWIGKWDPSILKKLYFTIR